jgi:hypothetical protein
MESSNRTDKTVFYDGDLIFYDGDPVIWATSTAEDVDLLLSFTTVVC